MRILLLLLVSLTIPCLAQTDSLRAPRLPRALYEEGCLSVKIRHEAIPGVAANTHIARKVILERILAGTPARVRETRYSSPHGDQDALNEHPLDAILEIGVPHGMNADSLATALAANPEVEYAERIPLAWPLGEPRDSLLSMQFALSRIHWTESWDLISHTQRDTSITIGIVDTGVEWYHQDLVQNLAWNPGEDANGNGRVIEIRDGRWMIDSTDLNGLDDDGNGYVDDLVGWNVSGSRAENDPDDFSGHGTHVAGIGAARTDNGIGIASPAVNLKFIPVAINATPQGPGRRAVDGVLYCARRGASVINCSWAQAWSQADQEALDYARSLGAVIVAAAGNSYSESLIWPAAYRGVLAVAAVADNDLRATYSSYGAFVDLCAPGGDYRDAGILSTWIDSSYSRLLGTSQAAPLVTGAIALLKSLHPDWSTDRILAQTLMSSDPVESGNPALREKLGEGRLNIHRMLTEDFTEPPHPRLTAEAIFRSTSGSTIIEPGDTVDLHLRLRSWTHAHPPRDLALHLLSDPKIAPLTVGLTEKISSDTTILLATALRFRIAGTVSPGTVLPVRVTGVCGNHRLSPDSIFTFSLQVGLGGMVLWDRSTEYKTSSSDFLETALMALGHRVHRVTTLPGALDGAKAVFISTGMQSNAIADFSPAEVETLLHYHESGGRLYLEGWWSAETANDSILASVFGCRGFRVRTGLASSGVLTGEAGSLAEGMRFPSLSRPWGFAGIVQGLADADAVTTIQDSLYGPVMIAKADSIGGRAVLFSYLLAELADADHPSRRVALLQRILAFFRLDETDQYCLPIISVDSATGHAPCKTVFSASSLSHGVEIDRWTWDLDGDDVDDAEGESITHFYNESGVYSIRLTGWSGTRTWSVRSDSLIRIFNGESALHFDGQDQMAMAPVHPDLALHDSLTVEAWIRPEGWGEEFLEGFGRIIDKGRKIVFFVNNRGSLILNIFLPSLLYANCETEPGSLHLGIWQHVAFTYHGPTSTAKLFINGSPVNIHTLHPFSGRIPDHAQEPLIIGNRGDRNRAFDGAIDELRIWNRIRTDQELARDYRRVLSGKELGLVGYFRCQEGRGNWIHDLSPTSQHLEGECGFTDGVSLEPISGLPIGREPIADITMDLPSPHPLSGFATIRIHHAIHTPISWSIHDMTGKEFSHVASQSMDAQGTILRLDGSQLSPGFYVITVQGGSTRISRAFVRD